MAEKLQSKEAVPYLRPPKKSFKHFFYHHETKEIFGRTSSSWGNFNIFIFSHCTTLFFFLVCGEGEKDVRRERKIFYVLRKKKWRLKFFNVRCKTQKGTAGFRNKYLVIYYLFQRARHYYRRNGQKLLMWN